MAFENGRRIASPPPGARKRQENKRLLGVLFRAAADAILSLTAGDPIPRGRRGPGWLAARRKRKPFLPGLMIVVHTFGSDLKWNPHLHVVVTAGGLSADGRRWVSGPKRHWMPAPRLATEWKLNVIAGVRAAHEAEPLFRRRLRGDRRRWIDVDKLLGHIRKKRWHILIGPSLRSADKALEAAALPGTWFGWEHLPNPGGGPRLDPAAEERGVSVPRIRGSTQRGGVVWRGSVAEAEAGPIGRSRSQPVHDEHLTNGRWVRRTAFRTRPCQGP